MRDYPDRLYHNTPSWVRSEARFHIRLRAHSSQVVITGPLLGGALSAAARRYHEFGEWWCDLFLLMPDHAHAILAFPREGRMTDTLRNWKRGTNRFQNIEWQEGFFDHRLRSQAES